MRAHVSLIALLAGSLVAGCGVPKGQMTGDDQPAQPDGGVDAQAGCPPGLAGASCVLALYDQVAASCDPAHLAELTAELDARAGLGPLWADGRALFRTAEPRSVAGAFNQWSTTALPTTALCGGSLVVGVGAVPTGLHPYKLVNGQAWSLDPANPAFAYDDFTGNADGKNSVINTPDSGKGHLVALDRVCSTTLGNCRDVTAYLPPGYDAPADAAHTYPVLFMHDGMNVWDDHDCCFGHTGWEVNVTLDVEIAAHRVAPVVVVAADQTTARNDEYGLSQTTMDAFMAFQINEIQPRALAKVRSDGHLFIAGSSLGGLVSMHLALRHPQTYQGAASLSGAFWPGMDEHTALRDQLPGMGKQPLAIYLDSGGNVAQNTDGAADSVEVRDLMIQMGWQRSDSPACAPGPNAVCYYQEPGATHDELAWKARAWRFLRFLFPG